MFRLVDLRSALGPQLLREVPGRERSFSGITNDSRKTKAGDLFVALKTEARDGHDFVDAAVGAGATGVIVQRDVEVPEGVAVFHVRNTRTALGNLAAQRRSGSAARAIVVTGSVGKTTTKELIADVLAARYVVLRSPANFNDEVGLSMTLFGLTSRHERIVLEAGMFEAGEIARLCEIARPEIAVVLNVGPSHMERLGSIEAIARAKSEAVAGLPEYGFAILNADDPLVAAMRSETRARVLTYGLGDGADVRATGVRSLGLGGTDFQVTMAGRSLAAHSPLPGASLLPNALAAIAVAVADGLALEDAVSALRRSQSPARLQVRETKSGALILDDCYNASPASMLAALSVLAETPGRHLALLGDMLELGPAEAEGHVRVGEAAARATDVLYTVGARAAAIAAAANVAGAPCVRHFDSRESALRQLKADLTEGDVLLVKASHGMALETVVAGLVA